MDENIDEFPLDPITKGPLLSASNAPLPPAPTVTG
jgi:hypothetical protein